MDALLSPLGLGLALLWSFAVLASVQLTVRLIMAFSVKRTALAAVNWGTPGGGAEACPLTMSSSSAA